MIKNLCFALVALAFLSVNAFAIPVSSNANYSAVTVGTSSASILSPFQANIFLDVYNDSATATVCCAFGAAATISGTACAAGELSLPAGWHRSWENNYIPADQLFCIASAASTPVTLGYK